LISLALGDLALLGYSINELLDMREAACLGQHRFADFSSLTQARSVVVRALDGTEQ
jgi:hypothetical protein